MSSRPSRGTARLAAILDALPDGLLLVNCNGTVVNANAIALEMFETPGTALVGRGLLDLLPEFDSKLIPGSMRRPEAADEQGRTKPTRMTARRTDGHEYPVEVTSASLDSGQAAYNDIHSSYTGDELLMIVVRDLSGTVDTEAELARSQRQTEMILRAASEGVVGTDTDGRVVLVNPAAAQILGFRASDLGGQELHPLILHSRAEGEPFPYEDSPLADTLKSGRKHRVRGQVLWSKSGDRVPVDLTTAPVRDGDQLVGAVMTFTDRRPYEELSAQHKNVVAELTTSHSAEVTALKEAHAKELEALKEAHAAELADRSERYAAEIEGQAELLASLSAQHAQLTAVLGGSLRGPLEELRGELSALASDPAGQLWPEANQILHHLAAGYARMTTLVDNVLGYQRLDAGVEGLHKAPALIEGIVKGGIDGAVELIGPGRAQFAVHAPPIEAEVDAPRLATAIAHLVADVCGVDSTGKTRAVPGGGYVDSTVVVAAAQRGDVVRIEVRGPFAGGDPVHEPIVRGIVQAHGGVLQTHEMPGMSGSAYVLDVPIGAAAGTIAPPEPDGNGLAPEPAAPMSSSSPEGVGAPGVTSGGRRRARRSSTDAFLDSPVGTPESAGDGTAAEATPPAADERPVAEPTGRRRARRGPAAPEEQQAPELIPAQQGEGSGRRRGRPSPAEAALDAVPGGAADAGNAVVREQQPQPQRQALALTSAPSGAPAAPSEGSVVTAAENAQGGGRPQLGPTVPPQGVPVDPQQPVPPTGRRARREGEPAALPALASGTGGSSGSDGHADPAQQPGGRRARRALAAAQERMAADAGPRTAFALPPADADRAPVVPDAPVGPGDDASAHHARTAPEAGHTPPQAHPVAPSHNLQQTDAASGQGNPGQGIPGTDTSGTDTSGNGLGSAAGQGPEAPGSWGDTGQTGHTTGVAAVTGPGAHPADGDPGVPAPDARRQPLPAEEPMPEGINPDSTQGRAFSVRTLGQGVPFAQHLAHQQNQPHQSLGGAGRRRKLAAPPEGDRTPARSPDSQQAAPQQDRRAAAQPTGPTPAPAAATTNAPTPPPGAQQNQPPSPPHGPAHELAQPGQPGGGPGAAYGEGQLLAPPVAEGRAYAIGAPDEGAEGPEPLDGPGGAVEVANRPHPHPVDDELPPEPLDNPRRLLVWPAPDVPTQQALSDRGYRPVIVNSREEVDAQIAAFPAALFVDPLTGPITRTALQSLRQAAVAAEVPVLVTAGLGQATREAAYGADPAVLLKALAPRDSEQHPSRVLLIEEHEEIAVALTQTLERRGMQVARAATDSEAVDLAGRMRPNLVVMDLMQVRRRRAGIVDWLRANGQLNRTPLVVYTSAGMDPAELPRLGSGETVLFLAERSTSDEVQSRIVDLLAKIGTN
ncbi:PAS domain-containing protein [Streptomyces sp. PgraA7]|uniref:hybrid sensor histidine kinase/response regulator n=1 Tax=unclassified Streptomyces TaxID=2593676 RepID=UPI000B506E6D|nr:PAS domain-containing protein [Streptomyces sp. PgraA7]MYW98850.1 PAS domain-containing protein [Streptomyces sp. SID8378]SNB90422.1 PAS domain S-box-containing protein [Streptomyces sp. PgraA7]